MIESGGTAPYAPTAAVLDVIHAYRDRPVPTPITTEVITKIGVTATIAPRTLQALKILDLVDANGNPTAAFQDLRKAGADEYQHRLADLIRAAYQEVFIYRDPAVDEPDKIADAFRSFEPVGMRDRMVRLFLGLCAEAGIIEEIPRIPNPPKGRNGKGATAKSSVQPRKPAEPSGEDESAQPRKTQPRRVYGGGALAGSASGADHLAVRGLLSTLPEVGSLFPDEKRKEWADAMLAVFNMIYLRAPETPATRTRVSSAEGGESDS